MPTDALGDERRRDIAEKLDHGYDCLAVYPSDSDFDGHYSHFCKTILWPLFHYQIPDSPRSKAYLDHSWAYYEKVNQLFANRIIKAWKRGDIIWIHDYHLLLVPSMVREKLPDAQIGFFLHTAFPSSEVFRCLAKRTKLLEGLLGANLIGFQTLEYCHHFLQTCNRLLCVEATPTGVQLEDHFVDVATFPIGIDPVALDQRRQEVDVIDNLQRIRATFAGKRLIVARDKMDTIRGVRQKLLAYEIFLNKHPGFRENVVLVQIATPTNEQADLEAKVSEIVTRINSKYSTLAHQPLVFLKQDIDYSKYLALLMAADALMITSLREGMNLTSHEFVLCQDGRTSEKKHGCLILSEFTGSASLFAGDEISVNPWDSCQCAEAIRRALTMKAHEKEDQWQRLLARVQQHNAERWLSHFLAQLHQAWDQHSRQDTVSIPRLNVDELCAKYRAAHRRLFLLDYEGTTTPKNTVPNNPIASPKRTIDALCNLTKDPRNAVYVLSERKPEDLDSTLRPVPGLGLVAENGGYVKEANSLKWHAAVDVEAMQAWKQSIQGILEYYRERVAGSSVEERRCSVVFHLEDERQAGECANQINDACRSQNVHAVPFDGGIVIESRDCDKGSAATRIFNNLTRNHSRDEKSNGSLNGDTTLVPEFLLVIGDAREDEAVYQWANKLGEDGVVRDVATVSVSSRNTAAQATLTQGVTGESSFSIIMRSGTGANDWYTGVLATLNKLAASDTA